MTLDRKEVQQRVGRVFAREDVLEACVRRDRGQEKPTSDLGVILNVMKSHGLTQGVIAGLTGIGQGRLSEFKNGVRQPTLDTLEKFADGMGLPEPARAALGLKNKGQGEVNSGEGTAAEPAGGADLLTLAWMAGTLNNHADRRAILRLSATLAAAPFLGVDESMDRLAYALLGPMALQEDTVSFLEQRTLGLHRIEAMFPARLVHRAITSHLREVTALLEGHADDPLWGRLARIAGESSVLAAWTAWDLGEAAHSARMYRITEAAARAAGDPAVLACAYAYRSYSTSGPAAHETARRMLAEARQYLPAAGEHATRAWVLGREAEEAAALGDPAAGQLIRQAAEAFTQVQPQQERPWTRFLDENRMNAMELSVYSRLGDQKKVCQLADSLLATVAPASKRAALVNADLGVASVRLGDVAGGIDYGRRSLDAVRAAETSFGLWRLEELAEVLARDSRARDFCSEVRQARRHLASQN
jgi:transcriptional regulator with XRE-family HTH domain